MSSPDAAPDALREPGRLAALVGLGLLDSPAEAPFDRLTRLAARILRAPVALVSLVDSDRQFFKSCVGLPEPWCSCRETPLSHSFCQHIVRSGKPLIIVDARLDPLVRDNRAIPDLGVLAYLGMPMTTADGYVLGSFCAIDSRSRQWSEDDIEILRDLTASVMTEIELREDIVVRRRTEAELRESRGQVAEQLRVATELNAVLEGQRAALALVNARLAEMAMTDGLTGLRNRRYFTEFLQDSYSLATRQGMPLSVILADVDEFKRYNDTFGHSAGDEVLRAVADVFREQTRDYDVVARYGGEEFVVLLPGTDVTGAAEVAGRLRSAVEARPWPLRPVTASFGVASLAEGCAGPWPLVELADAALYHSKRGGRNRVTHHPGAIAAIIVGPGPGPGPGAADRATGYPAEPIG